MAKRFEKLTLEEVNESIKKHDLICVKYISGSSHDNIVKCLITGFECKGHVTSIRYGSIPKKICSERYKKSFNEKYLTKDLECILFINTNSRNNIIKCLQTGIECEARISSIVSGKLPQEIYRARFLNAVNEKQKKKENTKNNLNEKYKEEYNRNVSSKHLECIKFINLRSDKNIIKCLQTGIECEHRIRFTKNKRVPTPIETERKRQDFNKKYFSKNLYCLAYEGRHSNNNIVKCLLTDTVHNIGLSSVIKNSLPNSIREARGLRINTKLTIEKINEDIKKHNLKCTKYEHNIDSCENEVTCLLTGIKEKCRISNIKEGFIPENIKNTRLKNSFNEKHKNIGIECIKYVGINSKNNIIKCLWTNEICESVLNKINRGIIPEHFRKSRCKKNFNDEYLEKGFECLQYVGPKSKNNIIKCLWTNIVFNEKIYSIMNGKMPIEIIRARGLPIPAFNLTIDDANEIVKKYDLKFIIYIGSDSKQNEIECLLTGLKVKGGSHCISTGKIPWDIRTERFKKQFNEKYFSAGLKCLEYISTETNQNKIECLWTGTICRTNIANIKRGGLPNEIRLARNVEYAVPLNSNLCYVYLCHTQCYGHPKRNSFRIHPDGFLTIGITAGSTSKRYGHKNLLEQICLAETYDCRIHEASLLAMCKKHFGPPNAGKEAWVFSNERKEKMTRIFNEHFNLLST